MKIAVSSNGKKLSDKVSEVFARCPYFVIAQIEEGKVQKTEVIENEIANQLGQAGISASQLMAEKEVEAIITKNVGPRALDALNQFKIAIYSGDDTIEKVLKHFIEGKLEKLAS